MDGYGAYRFGPGYFLASTRVFTELRIFRMPENKSIRYQRQGFSNVNNIRGFDGDISISNLSGLRYYWS